MLSLDDMAVFAQVVASMSFTEASRRLGVSKSAVSKAVARLEDSLGVRLLHRTTRKLGLTEAGHSFYASCQKVVDEAERAKAAISAISSSPSGPLRINAPIDLGTSFALPVIMEFTVRYPDIEVDLALQNDYIDLVQTSTDVALRVGKLSDNSLIAKKLATAAMVIVAAPSYLSERGTPQSPFDLREHRFLRYKALPHSDRMVLNRGEQRFNLRVSGNLVTNSGIAILEAAVAGYGIAFGPTFVFRRHLDSGALVRLLPEYQHGEPTPIYAVYPETRHVRTKVRLFIDALVAAATKSPLFS